MNTSPWIHQLDKSRTSRSISSDEKTDIAVIGAGIAGVSTAFFLLKHTDKKIILIEADKLAHGATGHNAGQITSNFEKPFSEMVSEFGLESACEAQRSIEYAWELLDEIYTEAGLDIMIERLTGYTGFSTKEQVLAQLESDFLRRSGGLRTSPVEILEDSPILLEIPEKFGGLIKLVPREEIALKLETLDTQYIAIAASQKGVMNSALFCQEIVAYLIDKYPDRFALYENTLIAKVVLKGEIVILDALKHTVECRDVVLCTNGFENFEIISAKGLSIDTRFHHDVHGVVAFMMGYLEKFNELPAVMSYFQKDGRMLTDNPGEPYFYVTRRPYEYEPKIRHSLVSVGGPDFALEDKAKYHRDLEFSDSSRRQIEDFIRRTYDKSKDLQYAFMWHGIMGYTTNMMRMIGPDPEHSRLFYNLGCNGVGILPSIYGGFKVSKIFAGEKFAPSAFDVRTRMQQSSVKPRRREPRALRR